MAVIDASAIIAWLVPEVGSEDVSDAIARLKPQGLFAPALIDLEVLNVLRSLARRGLIDEGYQLEALDRFRRLAVSIVDPGDRWLRASRILDLCRSFDLTAYDAAYLELALHPDVKVRGIVTLDKALRLAAPRLDVAVFPE